MPSTVAKIGGSYLPSVVAAIGSQAGKTIAITGTTSGVGFVVARETARAGAKVLLLNRASERSRTSLAKLREAIPEGVFVDIECDLGSFASVRKCAETITSDYPSLDVLFNNAGIMAMPDTATEDGYDCQMQVNHLSHFLLDSLVLPSLAACATTKGEARIVSQSSIARKDTKELETKYFGPGGDLGGSAGTWPRYRQSKLANLVYINALDEKLRTKGSNIKAICAHPGVSGTPLFKETSFFMRLMTRIFGQGAEDAAAAGLLCCCGPDLESGDFYGPHNLGGVSGPPLKVAVTPQEKSEAQMRLLWEASEDAVGTFDFSAVGA